MLSLSNWQVFNEFNELLTEAQIGILNQAEEEINKHFADFQSKLQSAIGQNKEGWLSGAVKGLGKSFTGNKTAQQSPYYGYRGKIGNMLNRAGERLRPRGTLEKDYPENTQEILSDLLNEYQVFLVEATIPDMVAELKQKIMNTLQNAMTTMFNTVKNVPQAIQTKTAGTQGKLNDLVARYGSVEQIPVSELSTIFKQLQKGGFGAKLVNATNKVPPLATPVSLRDI